MKFISFWFHLTPDISHYQRDKTISANSLQDWLSTKGEFLWVCIVLVCILYGGMTNGKSVLFSKRYFPISTLNSNIGHLGVFSSINCENHQIHVILNIASNRQEQNILATSYWEKYVSLITSKWMLMESSMFSQWVIFSLHE